MGTANPSTLRVVKQTNQRFFTRIDLGKINVLYTR